MHDIASIGSTLMEGLRRMDTEAVTLINGHPAGLYGYTTHCKSNQRKYEDVWSARLAEILREAGYSARCQAAYPGQRRKKCDLYVESATFAPTWIEFKTSWKSWFNRWDADHVMNNAFYLPYLYGPLHEGLSKSHSTAQDVFKLQELLPARTNVAFLLVGFDSYALPMDEEVEDLWTRLGLARAGWSRVCPDMWQDIGCPQCRIRSWFWFRSGAVEQDV